MRKEDGSRTAYERWTPVLVCRRQVVSSLEQCVLAQLELINTLGFSAICTIPVCSAISAARPRVSTHSHIAGNRRLIIGYPQRMEAVHKFWVVEMAVEVVLTFSSRARRYPR